MNWFLDFDDTLALGPITWALRDVFPRMITDNQLPFDEVKFNTIVLNAQQQANEANADEAAILNDVFGAMGWPEHLKKWLVNEIYSGYKVALFDDALPFLRRLKTGQHAIFLLSNNNHAPDMLHYLGIAEFFDSVYTPKLCADARAKPNRDMWDYILGQKALNGDGVALVGDDPWADGAFADDCRIQCWILDRMGRYAAIQDDKPYRFVGSFTEIEL
jgi:FMN phosphatase YigB (HAD superfamily)